MRFSPEWGSNPVRLAKSCLLRDVDAPVGPKHDVRAKICKVTGSGPNCIPTRGPHRFAGRGCFEEPILSWHDQNLAQNLNTNFNS